MWSASSLTMTSGFLFLFKYHKEGIYHAAAILNAVSFNAFKQPKRTLSWTLSWPNATKNKFNKFEWPKGVFEKKQVHKKKKYRLLPSNWEEYRP